MVAVLTEGGDAYECKTLDERSALMSNTDIIMDLLAFGMFILALIRLVIVLIEKISPKK